MTCATPQTANATAFRAHEALRSAVVEGLPIGIVRAARPKKAQRSVSRGRTSLVESNCVRVHPFMGCHASKMRECG